MYLPANSITFIPFKAIFKIKVQLEWQTKKDNNILAMFTSMFTFSSSRGRQIQTYTYILRAPSDEEFSQIFLSQNDFQELLLKQGIPTSESWVRVRRKCTKKNISLEMELECIDSTSKMIGTALLMHGDCDWWVSSDIFSH